MFENKVVFITGSSRGLGEAIAYRFAQSQCKLVLTWRSDLEAAEKVAQKCRELGAAEVMLVRLDVTDLKNIEEAISKIIQDHKKIDILINNSGVLISKNLTLQSAEEIEDQIRTNLLGTILISQACLPYLIECLINIGSNSALWGAKKHTIYAATKFAVRGFTQSLARECPNLKIYLVNPGMIATRMTGFKGTAPERIAEIVWNTATGRYPVASGQDINTRDYLDHSVRGRAARFIKSKIRKIFRL